MYIRKYDSNCKKRIITNINGPCTHTHTYAQVFAKSLTGKDPNPTALEESEKILQKSKKMLESYFLKDHKFIHSDEISIADLQAVCEFTQFWVAGVDPFKDRPRLAQWMKDCQEQLQPHFDEAHKMVYYVRDKGTFKGKL
jgi:glutathione S-transferase